MAAHAQPPMPGSGGIDGRAMPLTQPGAPPRMAPQAPLPPPRRFETTRNSSADANRRPHATGSARQDAGTRPRESSPPRPVAGHRQWWVCRCEPITACRARLRCSQASRRCRRSLGPRLVRHSRIPSFHVGILFFSSEVYELCISAFRRCNFIRPFFPRKQVPSRGFIIEERSIAKPVTKRTPVTERTLWMTGSGCTRPVPP